MKDEKDWRIAGRSFGFVREKKTRMKNDGQCEEKQEGDLD